MRTIVKPLFVVLSATAMLTYISCRKTDQPAATVSQKTNSAEKFFNAHRTNDPTEKVLVEFIKRRNDTAHFVEKTVTQIGYPRWDKAISFRKPARKNAGRGNNRDSANIFYVPFVRDSQHFVNASLIIKTQQGDTDFYYICDWQYKNKVHGPPAIDTTAERYALFFMLLDNRTFGHTEFNITDTSLFPAAVPRAGGGKKLGFVNISNSAAGGNNLWEYHELCVDFYVCGDPDWCARHGGCDYLNCVAGAGEPGHCYLVTSICDGWWEETGGGGGGTGGTGGTGGSGGGGSGGGPVPPNCGGPITDSKGMILEGCQPGWNPGGGSNPPPLPPNDSTIAKNLKRLMQKANNIPDSLHTVAQQDGNERTFSFLRGRGDTTVMYIRTGTSHTSSPTLTSNTFAILHTHLEDDLTAIFYKNESFDGPDMYKLYKNVAVDGYPIEVSILTTRDYYYAAVITDPIKFRDYIRGICGGTQNIRQIADILDSLHAKAMNNCATLPLCNYQKKTELGVLAITANNNSSISGIKVFRSPKQNITFTLLTP